MELKANIITVLEHQKILWITDQTRYTPNFYLCCEQTNKSLLWSGLMYRWSVYTNKSLLWFVHTVESFIWCELSNSSSHWFGLSNASMLNLVCTTLHHIFDLVWALQRTVAEPTSELLSWHTHTHVSLLTFCITALIYYIIINFTYASIKSTYITTVYTRYWECCLKYWWNMPGVRWSV